ncbi:NlpC/P60 family protein [Micrococcus terreus]|uniref:C40 family peptidase n=1 Tax=Micrococcus TaxID=1269 RepID=UPI0021A3FE89|nr:C40 family peptidase [Micrococcus terreus]MCT2090214.1 NlpC/P60 family protein [Micrococcus terreus]MDK7702423.1 NlpC/P60 family protein [Micrococcus terreus]WOO97218.1 NlpC/P60 family protein [Micrococcus terreus]
MSYPTRRARLEAEKQAHRSHRRRSLTMGAVGLTTVVGATVAGMGPAAANEGAYSAPSGSTGNTWSWEADSTAGFDRSSSAGTHTHPSTASTEPVAEIQRASYTTASSAASSGSGWGSAVRWATAKAADPGVRYVWGGNGPSGYDCSGFTQNAFAQAGKELPRNSKAQYAAARQYVSLDNLQVGDLVFWSSNGSASGIHHVAMYIGDGKIAHARNPQMGVAVTDVDYSPWGMMGTAARY